LLFAVFIVVCGGPFLKDHPCCFACWVVLGIVLFEELLPFSFLLESLVSQMIVFVLADFNGVCPFSLWKYRHSSF